MARIVIVGGGISGLSAAYDLTQDGRHDVTVLESSNRLGGKLLTHYSEGLIVEAAPDSIFTAKPWAVDLMKELGLEDEFVEPIGSGFSILTGGQIHAIPRAMASLIPSVTSDLESIGFLDAVTCQRIRAETQVPKGSGGDESIASFFRRRFGDVYSKNLAETLLAGIQAGDPELLSMKALYPGYIQMEQQHARLTSQGLPTATRRPGFLTLRGGLQKLIDALASRLAGVDIRLNYCVNSIHKTISGALRISGNASIESDAVILSIPSYASASLLRDLAPEASELLAIIRHVSTAVVSFGFPISAFPNGLHGNGYLVPADEPSQITGCTFTSSKWPGRSPKGTALIRAFIGRDSGLNVDEYTDDQLAELALASISKQLSLREQPTMRRVDRWTRAMPQYALGHVELIDRIEQSLSGLPILLAGGSYRGTGIPDCVRQGRQAAKRIITGWCGGVR